jgi:hypothetical protein
MSAENQLPPEILARASLRDNEYAWPVGDIPDVIEAARQSNLVNIGGQLQFRMPDAICECYWVEVDTHKLVSDALPWATWVAKTADAAMERFSQLRKEIDFLSEGRREFEKYLSEYERDGATAQEAMCFVWYVEASRAEDFAD